MPSPSRPVRSASLALIASTAMILAGCSAPPVPSTDDGFQIVASTTVYAAIAEQLAGDRATVSAIVDNPAQDPHSYEATARDQLAIAGADLIIANGGGYDAFMETLRAGTDNSARVMHVVDFYDGDHDHDHDPDAHESDDHDDHDDHAEEDHHDHDDDHDDHAEEDHADDHDHDHADYNEHVWFSFDTIDAFAEALAVQLTALDPEGAEVFAENLEGFEAQLTALRSRAATLAGANDGRTVVITEPVAEYLIEELDLDDVTPPAFPAAIEHGNPVAPATLLEVLMLVEGQQLALLVVNPQTTSPETEQVAAAAEQAGLAILEVPETLPAGMSYFDWVLGILDAAEVALQQ